MLEQVGNEVKIMYLLNHPYILKLYNHFEDDINISLVLEFAEGVHTHIFINNLGSISWALLLILMTCLTRDNSTQKCLERLKKNSKKK